MSFIVFVFISLAMVSFAYADEQDGNEDLEKQIRENLDNINLEDVPGTLKFLLGKPRINIEIKNNDTSKDIYGFRIAKSKIQDFKPGGLENPHYIIIIPKKSLDDIINAEDPMAKAEELYLSKDIIIEPQKFGAKIKYWFMNKLMGFFS